MTTKLPVEDQRHLRAAEGWLMLGNHLEADAELESITPRLRGHPDVLSVRWHIYAAAKKWEACVDLAEAVVRLAPDMADAWIHRSFALHELKRTQESARLAPSRSRPGLEPCPSRRPDVRIRPQGRP